MIQPQPVPTEFALQHIPAQPEGLIALSLFTPIGQHVSFWTSDGVKELIRQLQEILPQASSGLIVPTVQLPTIKPSPN